MPLTENNELGSVNGGTCAELLQVNMPAIDTTSNTGGEKTAAKKGRKKKTAKNDDGGEYCVQHCKRKGIDSGTMVQCHMCQMWVHPECVGEVENEIVTLWCCQSCRQMPTLVEKILQKVTALESCVTTIQESNQQLIALVQEQREEMRSLREDALQQNGRMSYADVTRTTQVKPTNTTLLVGNELLQDIHVDETKDGDPIKIRRLSGAAFDAIGSMIDDAATEDRINEIIIVAGTHEMTEDIPVEQIQVDFEVLLRKAKAVTSEITVSSVLPVIRDNAIKLGRLIEVNERLKATCDELEVKFVDNDANFTFRNGMVDFATLDRDETHLSQSGTERLMLNLSLPKQHQQDTHVRTTREAVGLQANKRATASHWTVVGRRSVPKPVGRRSVPHPDGRRSVPHPDGRRSVPTPIGRRSVPTPIGRRSVPNPDGRRSVPNVRHTPGQCTRCGESNHVTATCRHAQKVVCRTCLKPGHKDKHHPRE